MVAQQTPEDKIYMVFALSGGANGIGGKAGREEKREKEMNTFFLLLYF